MHDAEDNTKYKINKIKWLPLWNFARKTVLVASVHHLTLNEPNKQAMIERENATGKDKWTKKLSKKVKIKNDVKEA